MQQKPRLAITLGDPAGIGPETIVGCWSNAAIHAQCWPLVLGRPEIVRRAIALLRSSMDVVEVTSPEEAYSTPDTIACLNVGSQAAEEVRPATVDARGGRAAYDALAAAARLALEGRVDALVTAPLHKGALHAAGFNQPGHTELLAELCGVPDSSMMLYLPPQAGLGGPIGLGVVHVTLHVALRDVFAKLTPEAIVNCAMRAHGVMRRLGAAYGQRQAPKIGVCALNPHAGEEGLFGDEEQRIIAPAVRSAIAQGLSVEGPLPTDTLMVRASHGEFDAVVAMYHDQGHIALKLLGMHRAVNITLGLPIVRTSVAHGTAFDRAWQGTAETTGMIEAIKVAAQLATFRGEAGPPPSVGR